MATGFLIKASEVTMHDPLLVYTNATGGVLAYLMDMGISMYNENGEAVTTYSTDNYIDLSTITSTYCSTSSSYSSHANFKDQYKKGSASFLDCFLDYDGEDPGVAYLEINKFLITPNPSSAPTTTGTFKIALRGTRPHFKTGISYAVAGTFTMKRTPSGFVNNGSAFTTWAGTSYDGAGQPLRYLAIACGSGGGGGGTVGSDSACGGGGGCTAVSIVHLHKNVDHTVTVGTGGAGGYKGGQGQGSAGNWTYIVCEGDVVVGNTTVTTSRTQAGAQGGGEGRDGSYGVGKGGASAVHHTTALCIDYIPGADGGIGDRAGSGNPGKNGNGVSAKTIYCTKNNRADDKASYSFSAQSGGVCHDEYGGGGGASAMGPGGDGGTPGKSSTAPGKTPSNAGGGGGGATYIFLTYIRGGAGARGEFKLYY